MPILEFGSDAQDIITYAIESFDEIVQGATLGTAVDDAIDKQINGKKISYASLFGKVMLKYVG